MRWIAIANRFWVGGTGNWSDTGHWSATTGGTPGASKPTTADNVYFDANSFTAAGQSVTVDATSFCLNMDWRGVTNTPDLSGANALSIYGSLIFVTGMTASHTGVKGFYGTTVTITTSGVLVCGGVTTYTTGSSYTLLDDLSMLGTLTITRGTLNTGNFNITCAYFSSSGTITRAINLGSSIMTCARFTITETAGLTFNAGTSTIIMTSSQTFAGGGQTYNNVEFTGTPITVTGSNTFNDLKLTAGKIVNFTAGTTQTVTTLSGDGTSASKITIQSVTAGSHFDLVCTTGTISKNYYSIKDCVVSGGATFNAMNCINVSGNTGWNWFNIPAAPTSAHTDSKTATQIVMHWTDNSTDETGFYLYLNDAYFGTAAAGATLFTFTGLTAGTQYDLAVKATNANGDSAEAQLTEITWILAEGDSDASVIVGGQGSATKLASGDSEASVVVSVQGSGSAVAIEYSEVIVLITSQATGTKQARSPPSEVAVIISAQGVGEVVRGSVAQVFVSANGAGTKTILSNSEASTIITAQGSGQEINIEDSEAQIIISAQAQGIQIAKGASEATAIIVTAQGTGKQFIAPAVQEMLYLFDADETLVAILPQDSFFTPRHYEQKNGANTFSFSYPADREEAGYVVEGNLVGFKDLDSYWQVFEIKRIVDLHGDGLTRTAYCEHIYYELLDDLVTDQRPTGSAISALSGALAGTRWQVGIVDDLGTASTNFYYESALSAVQKIAIAWQGELQWRCFMSGGVITRYVDLLAMRGIDTGKQFAYSKDILEIEREVDATGVVTALYGRGKGVETDAGTGYGRRLTFADVVWITPTNPVNKPAGQEWVGDPGALVQFGRPGGRHRFGVFTNEDEIDPALLLQETWDDLQDRKTPRLTYRLKVAALETLTGYSHEAVRLGDLVRVIDREFKPELLVSARVVELTRDLQDPSNTEAVLGSFAPTIIETNLNIERQVNDLANKPFNTAWLDGKINILQNEINNTQSYVFQTPGDGILIMDAATFALSTKAMKIGGGIFALANTKTGDQWNWRAFGDGSGFTADEINAGKIRAGFVQIGSATEFDSGYDPAAALSAAQTAQTTANAKLAQPGYVTADSEGIKVFDNLSALRVQLGSWVAGIRKYGLKVIGGEMYTSEGNSKVSITPAGIDVYAEYNNAPSKVIEIPVPGAALGAISFWYQNVFAGLLQACDVGYSGYYSGKCLLFSAYDFVGGTGAKAVVVQGQTGNSPLIVSNGDVAILDRNYGLVLVDANSVRWRVKVSTSGVLTTTQI